MSPRLTAAITVAIHELKRRPYSTIRNDTVAELEAALKAEAEAQIRFAEVIINPSEPNAAMLKAAESHARLFGIVKNCDSCKHRNVGISDDPCYGCFAFSRWTKP